MHNLEKHHNKLIMNNQNENAFLNVHGMGLVMKNPNYSHRDIFPDTLFEYVIEGEGYIYYNGVRYDVKAGDCIIARGGIANQKELHYGSSTQNPYLKLWFTASGRFIDNMFDAFGVTNAITIKKCNILKFFQDYVMSLSKNGFDCLSCMTAIITIMDAVYNNNIPTTELDNFDNLVDNYIERNMQYPPSPAQAASNLGMSQRGFSEYFAKRFNTSYRKYMRTRRLLRAKKILESKENDNDSISEIANNLGFCDQSYFSNCFYKEFGIYPTEYRRQMAKLHNQKND